MSGISSVFWQRILLGLCCVFVLITHSQAAPQISKPTGKASYYGPNFHGKCCTANGERVNMHALTAAHPTLPFGSRVKVTNLKNKKSVIVRINDRGPFHSSRIIDLSLAAFKKIAYRRAGIIQVRLELLDSNAKKVKASPKPAVIKPLNHNLPEMRTPHLNP